MGQCLPIRILSVILILITGILQYFYAYLGLLNLFCCVCFCHRCENKWCWNKVLCYQVLSSGLQPKWNAGGGNLTRSIEGKLNEGSANFNNVCWKTVIVMKASAPQGWMYHLHHLAFPSLGAVGGEMPRQSTTKLYNVWKKKFSLMVDYHFKVEEGVTKEKYNEFCDGSNYFLRPPKLLCEFLRQDQTSSAQQAVDHLNIFK